MNHSNSNFSILPDDVVVEILYKVPVKSLIRFSGVCKSWKTLIKSDDFVKSHLELSLQDSPSRFNDVLIYSEPEFRQNYRGNFILEPNYVFVGCCNGVLCYYTKIGTSNSISIHLWNPATQWFRSLQEGTLRASAGCEPLVKFVFDPVKDEYKVVKIYKLWLTGGSTVLEGEVYSFSTNTWGVINLSSIPPKRWAFYGRNMVAHNGAFHWITVPALGHPAVLCVFHTDEERFDEVSLPDCVFKTKPMPWLGTYKEFIALSVWRDDFEVWVMKEYGVWTKQIVLENTWHHIHSPYGITGSGKILTVNWNGEDVLYDAERQQVEEFVKNKAVFIKANSVFYNYHVVVAEYVESLVSLPPPVEPEPNTQDHVAAA